MEGRQNCHAYRHLFLSTSSPGQWKSLIQGEKEIWSILVTQRPANI